MNGKVVGVNISMSRPSSFNSTVNYIGKTTGFKNMLDAELDDLRIFNRSLSQSEIVKILNAYVPDDLGFINASLTNYWAFSSNLMDSIGGISLINPVNVTFNSDRYNSINSAIYLNKGYLSLPPATYFKGKIRLSYM